MYIMVKFWMFEMYCKFEINFRIIFIYMYICKNHCQMIFSRLISELYLCVFMQKSSLVLITCIYMQVNANDTCCIFILDLVLC